MMIKPQYDVVVVGSGPAGSSAATFLALKGYDVALLEKTAHPRHTVGENLIPHFWRYTDMLGVSQKILDANFIKKGGGMTYWNGDMRGMSFDNFGYERPGLHVERDEFDKLLFDHASSKGVQTFEFTKVTDIIHNDSSSILSYTRTLPGEKEVLGEIKAKYVIDATGQGTLTSKKKKFKQFDDGFRFHSFYSYYPSMNYFSSVDEVCSFNDRYSKRPKTFQKNIGGWGWVWHIVLKDSVSVGLVVPRENLEQFKAKGDNLMSRFKNTIEDDPILSKLITTTELIDNKMYSIKDYSYTSTQFTDGNTFMIGDAAAFVDPINSAGVSMAFYSGFLSSWFVDKCLKRPQSKSKNIEFYNSTLKNRFNLFRAAAIPQKELSEDMLHSCNSAFKTMSEDERQLIMTQLTLTQRSSNIPDHVKNLGTTFENIYEVRPYEESNYDFEGVR